MYTIDNKYFILFLSFFFSFSAMSQKFDCYHVFICSEENVSYEFYIEDDDSIYLYMEYSRKDSFEVNKYVFPYSDIRIKSLTKNMKRIQRQRVWGALLSFDISDAPRAYCDSINPTKVILNSKFRANRVSYLYCIEDYDVFLQQLKFPFKKIQRNMLLNAVRLKDEVEKLIANNEINSFLVESFSLDKEKKMIRR